ncbi:MAG: hypothetical protein IJT83_04405, partial [Victivallales bacterium]|nr:hypothetical protein [Victivallales bacterium]
EAASFDPSTVGQTISRSADPPVSIDIVRPVVDGKRYVVLVVYPFKDMPHVCSNAFPDELRTGVFYVRTPDARSHPAEKSSELHQLIQRALRNQRQMLGRMLRGILYEERQVDSNESIVFPPFLERSRRQAREQLGNNVVRSKPLFEVICRPANPFDDLTLTKVRQALHGIASPRLADLPWGNTSLTSTIHATNESVCGKQLREDSSPVCFWEFFMNGLFYASIPLPLEDGGEKRIQAKHLMRLSIVAVSMIGQFYSMLQHAEALLDITFRVANSFELELVGLRNARAGERYISGIMDIEVTKQRSAGDLEGGAASDAAAQLFAELCERFNASFDDANVTEIRARYDAFLEQEE